ncbi:alpha-hydroxy-acid oxidizing protein [Paenibacillus sp. MBLB4367]|uniref:alpha-hydroxy-acid oxidizing protein n=1 Tax=Paenibacillus sp. MBLB4367 TaxID=3384767 RepID=UPI0039082874
MNYGTKIRKLRTNEQQLPGSDRLPISFADWEAQARIKLTVQAFDYAESGAGSEATMRANRDAFEHWRIVQRILVDVADRNLSLPLLNQTYPFPVGVAPIGRQSLFHTEGEVATARAAASMGVLYIHSMVASRSLEDIAGTGAPRWMQLYLGHDLEVVASIIRRAENAGFTGIVLTFDRPEIGWREKDLFNAVQPFTSSEGVGNLVTDPVVLRKYNLPLSSESVQRITVNPGTTWEGVAFVRSVTDLPMIIKGISHPADAAKAIEAGADAIVVSNHGGRHLDGAAATLDMLPLVAAAVKGAVPVLFDSGLRHGADMFKALSLGADFLLLGRPYVYGLSLAGEKGVRHVLENMIADFDLTMGIAGHRDVQSLSRDDLLFIPSP